MISELSRVIHNLVLENEMPARELAKSIGKPYSTLLREINPYDGGAKLGVETLMQIMRATGDPSPLEFMARDLGLRVERTGQRPRKRRNKEQTRSDRTSIHA